MNRPQPIGIYPFPANFLVVHDSFCDSAEQDALLKGSDPQENSLYRLAIDGGIEAAMNLLSGDEPEAQFNRFVLAPSAEAYESLSAKFSGELKVLLDVAAFTMNLIDEPPSADDVEGEIKALALSAIATSRIETGDRDGAFGVLNEARAAASVSPVFAAQISGNLAEAKHQFAGASAEVATLYRAAIDGLKNTSLEASVATLNLNAGICYHELSQGSRGALLEAVKHYQESLKYFTREEFPEEFAFTQNNLALAYLSVPMTEASDTLRIAIAIQSLREALKVYTRETHPDLWASTQLNLANALQHAPSGHVEENLMESVSLYEEILSMRQPTENPVGYARVLANQGNALAHLGVFDHAIPKLTEARDIFAQVGEADSAASINELLDEIGQQRKAATSER